MNQGGNVELSANQGAAAATVTTAESGTQIVGTAVRLGGILLQATGISVTNAATRYYTQIFNNNVNDRQFQMTGATGLEGFIFRDSYQMAANTIGQSNLNMIHLAIGNAGQTHTHINTGIKIEHLSLNNDFNAVHAYGGNIGAAATVQIKLQNIMGSLTLGVASNAHATLSNQGYLFTDLIGGLLMHSSHSGGAIAFKQGTSERMRVSTSGNLLVGSNADTTTVNQKLQVTGKALLTVASTVKGQLVQPLGRISTGEIVSWADPGDTLTASAVTTDATTPVQILDIIIPADSSTSYFIHLTIRDTAAGDTRCATYYTLAKNIGGTVSLCGAGIIGMASLTDGSIANANLTTGVLTGMQRIYCVGGTGTAGKTLIWELIAIGRNAINPLV